MGFVLGLTLAMYLLSGALSIASSVKQTVRLLRLVALLTLAVGVVANTLWIVMRWHAAGFPPFAEMYGCLVLLALCVGLVSLSLEVTLGIRFVGGLGSLAAAGLLVFSLRHVGEVKPLVPALQSPFFAPHVLAYFIAYGALSVAGLAALLYPLPRLGVPLIAVPLCALPLTGLPLVAAIGSAVQRRREQLLAGIETWMDRSVQIGLPFLTLGLVLGAFWAQAAWGDYWSWDPKEVWALITWLLVVAWFHLRTTGRRGVLTAVLMLVIVSALYFTLLGNHLLPTARQSLHVYTQP